VPCAWLRRPVAAVAIADLEKIHRISHFGVERTYELAQERHGAEVSKKDVRRVVKSCQACARVDPARKFSWDHGTISSSEVWEKLATDITHIGNRVYLTMIDVATKFTIWRQLKDESARAVVREFEQVFSEFSPPRSVMSDNGSVFRSREFQTFLKDWDVKQILSCSYRPEGNSVVERVHRTIKRIVKRSGKPVSQAVFWLNNTKGVSKASPYELLFSASPRKPGIKDNRVDIIRPKLESSNSSDTYADIERNPFSVGDKVYLRTPTGKCDDLWSGPHTHRYECCF
jgi:transposase InsO family protein